MRQGTDNRVCVPNTPPLVPVEGIGGGAASWLKSNVVFSSGASDGDSLEVSAVMRAVLSVTLGLMVLMRLDLFFTGVPNFPPSAKAVMLRVGGERALLLTTNFSRVPRGK